jgi:peptidoglycan/LPS O-acetylase OafA/YrhL
LKYQPSLDGLRALALLPVMAFHFQRNLMTGGALGVDVFFVLSGYLITRLLIAEHQEAGKIDYPAFLIRRFRRLGPAMLVMLGCCAIAGPHFWPAPATMVQDMAAAATYTTNFWIQAGARESPLSHTWSLSVEEQFYLLWPWLMLWLIKLPRQQAVRALVLAWAVFTLARCAMTVFLPPNPAPYYLMPFHATGLMLGAALAFRPLRTTGGRLALGVLVALFIGGNATGTFAYTIAVAEIATVLIIADPPALLSNPALRWLGKISYGTYLWHIPLLWLMPGAGSFNLMGMSLLAGALSYHFVEPWATSRSVPFLGFLLRRGQTTIRYSLR